MIPPNLPLQNLLLTLQPKPSQSRLDDLLDRDRLDDLTDGRPVPAQDFLGFVDPVLFKEGHLGRIDDMPYKGEHPVGDNRCQEGKYLVGHEWEDGGAWWVVDRVVRVRWGERVNDGRVAGGEEGADHGGRHLARSLGLCRSRACGQKYCLLLYAVVIGDF